MVRWYLARHGRTAYNRDSRVQGHNQTPLDERGLVEAESLRNKLADEIFVAAFSSDLIRTQQMTQIVLGSRQLAFDTSLNLRELDYGLWYHRNVI